MILLNSITFCITCITNMWLLNATGLHRYARSKKWFESTIRDPYVDRLHRETNRMLLLKQIPVSRLAIPAFLVYKKKVYPKKICSRVSHVRERNPPRDTTDYTSSKSTRSRVVISDSDRRTDIFANTRLLAPIVPLYTTEIPSKMQEDTGRAGRNS